MSRPWSSRRLTFVPQLTASECPVACLQMVLHHHGCFPSRRDIRATLKTGRDGASALAILEAARRFGLEGRGIQLDARALRRLSPGTILHWNTRHFVVLERVRGRWAWILDPAVGRRRLSLSELGESFSGLALEFVPSPGIAQHSTPDRSSPSPAGMILRRAILRPGILAGLVGSSIALAALGVAGALVVAALVERASSNAPVESAALLEPVHAIVALAAGTAVARTVHLWGLHSAGQVIEQELSRQLQRGLLVLPWGFCRRRTTEDLAQRLAGVERLRQRLLQCLSTVAVEGSMVLVYLAVLWSWARPVACAVVGLAALQGGATAALRHLQEHAGVAQRKARARLVSFEDQILRGLFAIKAVGAESAVAKRWSARRRDVARQTTEREHVRAAFGSVLEGLGLVLPLALMAVGVHEVSRGALALPSLIGACFLSVFFLRALVSVLGAIELIPSIRATLMRLDDVLCEIPESRRNEEPSGPELPAPIELRRVTAGRNAAGAPVLHEVSATLAPSRHIAILGRSGSGKSLVAALLTGLATPCTGQVLIGGHALEGSVPPWASLVPQMPTLFDGSLYDNIVLGMTEANESQVLDAARIVGLHERVVALPQGYQTSVLDGGTGLSEDLRRRLTLARAVIRTPALLVLDESAAGLGPEAECTLIRRVLAGSIRTVVTVTHHRQTAESADVVVLVEEGRLVDFGRPAELQNRSPLYRELAR